MMLQKNPYPNPLGETLRSLRRLKKLVEEHYHIVWKEMEFELNSLSSLSPKSVTPINNLTGLAPGLFLYAKILQPFVLPVFRKNLNNGEGVFSRVLAGENKPTN